MINLNVVDIAKKLSCVFPDAGVAAEINAVIVDSKSLYPVAEY